MAEYIEREAAIEAVSGWYKKALRPENMSSYNMGERAAYITALGEISELPAADVRPVVRGHIEEDENTYLFCSECNCDITLAAYETPDNRLVLRPNFCPNCGADMRTRAE